MINGLKEIKIKGFSHLDIKPDKILISFKAVYKFTDFGTARNINL